MDGIDIVKKEKFSKKDMLVEAAIKEFSELSFQEASLNNILQNSNVSKGVFYHHFKNKEDLYLYIVGVLLEKKKTFLISRMSPEDFDGDIFQVLRKSILYSLQFAQQNPEASNFSTMLMKERGNAIFEKITEKYNVDNDTFVSGLIRKAIDKGNLRDDLSPEFIKNLIVYILNNMNGILDTKGVEDYASKIDDLLKFLEDGLKGNENKSH